MLVYQTETVWFFDDYECKRSDLWNELMSAKETWATLEGARAHLGRDADDWWETSEQVGERPELAWVSENSQHRATVTGHDVGRWAGIIHVIQVRPG